MIALNILRRLHISDKQLKEQTAFFLEFYPNKAKIRLLIDRLSDETRYCYMCDSQGECSLFMAICYFVLGEYGKGILRAEEAEQHFLNINNTWNLIHALELHGLILDAQGNRHQAILTYKEAIRTLQEQYIPTHDQDYDPQVEELQKEFDLLISEGNPIPASANLQLGIMPVYSGVQAGPFGPTWMELPLVVRPSIETLTFRGKSYSLFSTIPGIREIHVQSGKEYGWVEVFGDSMDAAKPVPICEHDYVLFYKASTADHYQIVIVAHPDSSKSGYQWMIKRYDQTNSQFLSETKAEHKHPPIAVRPKDTILGIVIAVAKPL